MIRRGGVASPATSPWTSTGTSSARSGGYENRIEMWRAMSVELAAECLRRRCLALVDEAAGRRRPCRHPQQRSVPVGNARVGRQSQPEFEKFEVLVDCTEFGERKPAPGPYLKAAADFGSATQRDRLPRRHAVLHRRAAPRHDRRADRSAGPVPRFRPRPSTGRSACRPRQTSRSLRPSGPIEARTSPRSWR